jgi:hypothetical protein
MKTRCLSILFIGGSLALSERLPTSRDSPFGCCESAGKAAALSGNESRRAETQAYVERTFPLDSDKNLFWLTASCSTLSPM